MFHIITTTGWAFSWWKKGALVKKKKNMYKLRRHTHLKTNYPLLKLITLWLCSHPLFGFHKRSENIDECQSVKCFPHGVIQGHCSTSYALSYQMLVCQIAAHLLSVTRQNIKGYWWNVQRLLSYHEHLSRISWANIIK